MLNLTFGFALLLGLGVVTRGRLHKQHCVTVNNGNILNSSAIGFGTRDVSQALDLPSRYSSVSIVVRSCCG